VFGLAEVATTEVDAWAVVAMAAELAIIDPAALSVTIAEITVRRMLMIFLHGIYRGQQPAASLHRPARAFSESCGVITSFGYSMHIA
jgi:uncharacterized membrane protein YcfT